VFEIRIGGGDKEICWEVGGTCMAWFFVTVITGIPSSSELDNSIAVALLSDALSSEAKLRIGSRIGWILEDDGFLNTELQS
jgi:hypothetical protein